MLASLPPDSLTSLLMVPAVFPKISLLTGTYPVYPGKYSRCHVRASFGRCLDSKGRGAYYIITMKKIDSLFKSQVSQQWNVQTKTLFNSFYQIDDSIFNSYIEKHSVSLNSVHLFSIFVIQIL